ncbi:kinase-like protein [Coprinopsis marcescibilis]|uniref:Kinase-like protein n=1 Tax=Coprinopsis marcescibilis TaxID=230819 RepID=A0A5C3L0B0_COPMA|nr:kinase-like protein [Coprinopsis marcescibilis]
MTVCPRGSTSGNITKIIKILGESPSPSRLTAENIEAWLTSNAAQLDAATQLLPPEHRPFALTLSSQTFARSLLLCLAALLDANADDCHFKHLNDLQARISSASASRQLSRYRSVLEDLVRLIGSLPDLDPSLQSTAQEAIKIDLQFMAAWFLDNHPSLDSVTTFIGTYLQDERQELVNFFQTLLDLTELKGLHALLLETQLMLAKLTGLVPRGLVYDGDVEFERDCTFVHGQYGSIWRGTIEGQVVTIKPVRRPINRPPQLIKSYAREAILWGRLDHPNIAPFYGMYLLGTGERRLLSVITPWMSNGNVLDYLSRHPVADRTKLILDVCHGLNYLHAFNPPVIHGNLKSTNVLITPRGRACLTDIGFHMPKPKFDYRPTAFCWRFSAPEILFAAYPKPSTSSDVYALGSVCYEIFSPHPRFSSLSNPSQLLDSIRDNKPCLKPDRMDLNLWEMVQRCWDPFPQKRPSMGAFLRHVSMQIATVPRIPNGMEGWDARLNPRFLEPPSFSIKRPSNLLWLSRTLQVVEDVPRAPEVTQFSEWLAADAGYLDSVICFFPREHREFASDLTKALFPRLHLFCLASILAKPSCENAG